MGYNFGQGYAVDVEINGKNYPVMVAPNKAKIFETIQQTANEISERTDDEAIAKMEELVLEALDELLGESAMDEILGDVVEEDKNLINYVGLAQYILRCIGDSKPETKKQNRANRRKAR